MRSKIIHEHGDSPAAIVIVGAHWRVPIAELARWLGLDVATLHRWRDAETFARSRGAVPDLVRALAPRWQRLTLREAELVREQHARYGVIGSMHVLMVIAMLPVEIEPTRPTIPTRSRFGPRPRRAAQLSAGTLHVATRSGLT